MRKPSNPGFHSLGALSRAVSIQIGRASPSRLSLAGKKPRDWPDRDTPGHARLIRRIQSGLLFYSMEYFLWPNNRDSDPIDIWVGHTLRRSARHGRNPHIHLHKLSEDCLPSLAEVLWSPRRPDLQPVALRTYADALVYGRAGALLERRFLPLLTAQWRVREHLLEPAKVPPEFHQRFRFKELYYLGDYPSRVAKSMETEIRHVLLANNAEPYVPPSAAIKNAFQRQLALLQKAWSEASNKKNTPTIEWVREHLLHPEYRNNVIEDGYADRYRKALLTSLERAEAD